MKIKDGGAASRSAAKRMAEHTAGKEAVKTARTPARTAPGKVKSAAAKGTAQGRAMRFPPPGIDIKPNVWKRMSAAERQEVWSAARTASARTAAAAAGSLAASASGAAAVASPPRTGGAASYEPVLSMDTSTYLSKVGNPQEYRITMQQAEQLRDLGLRHSVIGIPGPNAATYAEQMAALRQETRLLQANGIRTDVYSYLYFSQDGRPASSEAVRAQVQKQLDDLKGLGAQTFWFDVEFDARHNPPVGVANHQRILDAAYQTFQDWKAANPGEAVEFGIYTSESCWQQMVAGPKDPYATKYADLGVPVWAALYPKGYAPAHASAAGQDMARYLGEGFGGWSMEKGNVRGWQYCAGEHTAYVPTFNYGIDRNVWLLDSSLPDLPITAAPTGYRSDLPIQNQALYELIKGDQGKPVGERAFKSMQDVINHCARKGVSYKSLGLTEALVAKYRWEDPWKAVHGLPLGQDQFLDQPVTPPATTTTAPPTAPPTTPPTTPPATPPTAPATTVPAGSPMDLLRLAPGTTRKEEIKRLQDTLTSLGYLEDLSQNSGYGMNFGPKTQAALKAFQGASGLPQSGVVDRGTVLALAKASGYDLGFDPSSPFAACFGLSNGASGAGDKAAIKLLQDTLLGAGYLPASITEDGGYGKRFGPKTEAALEQFQLENGLPQTGAVDLATMEALAHPRPRPAGFAAGAAVTWRDRLGLPTSAPYTAPDGSLRQDFDHGTVFVTPDRVRHVQVQGPNGPQDVVPPQKLGTAQTVEEADASFLTQWGPTATNDPPKGSDIPWGYSDCGPTCGVMAMAMLGLAPKPSAADAYLAIDHMRDLIFGRDTTKSDLLGLGPPDVKGTVGYGLTEAGAQCAMLGKDELDAALDRGNPVIVGSSSVWAAWGADQKAAGNYLNSGNPGGHFVIVMGRAPNGNYLVGDPLVKGGAFEVTPEQMKTCLGGAWSSNSLMEVSAP